MCVPSVHAYGCVSWLSIDIGSIMHTSNLRTALPQSSTLDSPPVFLPHCRRRVCCWQRSSSRAAPSLHSCASCVRGCPSSWTTSECHMDWRRNCSSECVQFMQFVEYTCGPIHWQWSRKESLVDSALSRLKHGWTMKATKHFYNGVCQLQAVLPLMNSPIVETSLQFTWRSSHFLTVHSLS